MQKIKLLRSILIPTLGISVIGTIATVCTSCGNVSVTGVKLDDFTITLALDETKKLTPTVLPENATNKNVTWSSDDESVATVESDGTIMAKGLGNATITVKTNDGGKTANCEVTVIDQTRLNQYIAIAANEDSTLELKNVGGNNPDLQYSKDGTNWTAYSDSESISIPKGQTYYLIGNNPTGWSIGTFENHSTLLFTGDVSISGNVMGLLDNGAEPGESGDITDIPCDYCFRCLFENSTGITSVSEDFLPATTLANNCYRFMFHNCTSLSTAPYLPARTLANDCYRGMFHGCASLTTAPDLPAASLVGACYMDMFNGCTSLTTAPKLPAKSLANNCYRGIFNGCTSLSSIQIDYMDNYSDDYFKSWVNGVADSGIFHYNGSQTAQDFGLPSGWQTQNFN